MSIDLCDAADVVRELRDGDSCTRLDAIDKLSRTPVSAMQAVPLLLRLLADENKFVRRASARLLGSFPEYTNDITSSLLLVLSDADFEVARQALSSLVRVGGIRGPEILEALKNIVCDRTSNLADEAANALSQAGTAGANALIECIDRGHFVAVKHLIRMGDFVIPLLDIAVSSGASKNRNYFVYALRKLKQFTPTELIQLLLDTDMRVVDEALDAIDPANTTTELVETLATRLDTRLLPKDYYSQSVPRKIVKHLITIGHSGLIAANSLISYLKADDDYDAYWAIDALAAFGSAVVPLLIAELGKKDTPLRLGQTIHMDMLNCLRKLGPKASDAEGEVIGLLSAEHIFVRFSAALTLVEIGAPIEPAIPTLIEILKFRETYFQRNLLDLLPKLGNRGNAILPDLLELSKKEDNPYSELKRVVDQMMQQSSTRRPQPLAGTD